jgi:hypothetical protein
MEVYGQASVQDALRKVAEILSGRAMVTRPDGQST